MAIWEFEGKRPIIGTGAFVFPSADVIGDVVLGDNCYVGPGAVVRGDYGRIVIGDASAVEENVVIHARPEDVTEIGQYVTLGHGAIIHNAHISDYAVIGMGSIVSDFAQVGEWAVVAEGAVVRNRQEISPNSIAAGIPAKIIGEIDDNYRQQWTHFKEVYAQLANQRYPQTLKRLD